MAQRLYRRFIVPSIKNTDDVADVDEWMRFLNGLPTPTDAVSYSFNKYLCRMWYVPKSKALLLNALASIRLIGALPHLLRSGNETLPAVAEDKLTIVEVKDVGLDDILPESMVEPYEHCDIVENPSVAIGCLSREAKRLFLSCVKSHPFRPYYLLYLLKELSAHSALVQLENPRAVAVYVNERNVALSVLTKMYEDSGRELVSFMHGEYLLQLIQGFMVFSKYYVWDDSYARMFAEDLRCCCGQYIMYTPKKLLKKWDLQDVEPDHFCTYYFSGESERSVKIIARLFRDLQRRGKRCLARPHPRYSHVDLINKLFPSDLVENPETVSLRESLASARYAVGLNSTVLSEALVEGRGVLLDDVSDPAAFEQLEKRQYRLLGEKTGLLSEILSKEIG